MPPLGSASTSADASPQVVGRYALYDKIASGGMASVYLARLLGPVGFARTVAVKRMHAQLAEDPEFVSMFLDEARLAARISHPNVVATLDVVATGGELFLVMEYVSGESLSRLIRAAASDDDRVPPPIAAAMLVGVLHGLHAAHEAKSDRGEPLAIVHRDVSPHNVIVGVDGVARVLDFGVAKAVGRIQTTREGQLKGKLPYMAPEQVSGCVERASDVYAAAVVLWESLAGRRLFDGDNEAQILHRIMEGARVPPSRFAPDVPPALDAVTMRGLHKDLSVRFATARDMARSLEEALPLATASRVGDWVEAMARETLDLRNARIAAIESDTPPTPAEPASTTSSAPPPPLPVPRPPPRRSTPSLSPPGEELVTQLSTGSVTSPGRGFDAPRRALWLAITAIAAVAFAAGLIVASRPPVSARTPSSEASTWALPAPQVQSGDWTPVPIPADSLPISPGFPGPDASTLRKGSRHVLPSCDPPWVADSRGVHVFKRECL